MRRFRQILVLFLALAWVPVTAHCAWSNLPGLEFFHCDSESPDSASPEGGCCDEGCCAVESSSYLPPESEVDLPAPPAGDLGAVFVCIDRQPCPLPARARPGVPTVDPPDGRRSWQFRARAALPPRAPCLRY